MQLTIDGIIYQKRRLGGISRIFSETLPRMCMQEESLFVKLFTMGKPCQRIPSHKRIEHAVIPRIEDYLRPNRIFKSILPPLKKFLKQRRMGNGKNRIWHSTYFTIPEKWMGNQVVTVHDMIYEYYPQGVNDPHHLNVQGQKARCIENANAIICVSETTLRDLRNYYKLKGKATYVIYPAAGPIFRKMTARELRGSEIPRKPFILYLGLRSIYKNFDLLVHAYSKWTNTQNVDLVVVGGTWSTEEKRKLEQLKLIQKIHLITGISDLELCRLYNLSAGLVYPSIYEGFGIPLVEAMACGCPIIASRIPSTEEVAADYPFYFEATDIESLLHALDLAIEKGRDSERVQKGLKRANLYSWDACAARTLEVYRDLTF